jgi:hypothetical protein
VTASKKTLADITLALEDAQLDIMEAVDENGNVVSLEIVGYSDTNEDDLALAESLLGEIGARVDRTEEPQYGCGVEVYSRIELKAAL